MLIPYDQPLNLVHTFECGQAFRWQRVGEGYYGVVSGNIIGVKQSLLGLEFRSYPEPEEEMVYRLEYYLRLDDDLPSIYDRISVDDRMRKAIAQLFGLRLLRQDPWECLLSFICSLNSNIARISTSIESLCERLGARLEMDDQVRHSFPTPSQVMGVGETGLRLMGMGFRAKYMAETARIVAEDGYDLEGLREFSYEDAKKALMELPGVGDKVADCVLLFSLDKLDAFPIDRWLRRAVEEWYLGGDNRSYQEIREWALELFGPYAGYAQQYLFHRRRLEKSPSGDGRG
ncbi:MAG: DNA-3-methyladenine glycosylase family protein [Dehalococcoidia bacterium]